MRSLLISLLALAAAAPTVLAKSAGCGKATTLSSGTKSITVNGKNRQYVLQMPSGYNPDTAYKLVFGFHWLNGNMNNVAPGYYGLRDLAKETAIFVAPNGINSGWGNSGGEDITFTDQLVDLIKTGACVDEDNIFATGFSYGGAMSFSVACSRPDVFKAVAVIAGAQLSGCSGGTKPVAYLGIHGVSDSVLNISQGRSLRDKFLKLNQCASKNAPEPSRGAGSPIKTTYECNPRYPVWWIAHGGDHVGDPRSGNNYWAATESWNFFTNTIVDSGNSTAASNSPPTSAESTQTAPPATGGNMGSSMGGNMGNTGNCAARFAQCGGQGYSGPTCCQSGSTCNSSNQYYSQCV